MRASTVVVGVAVVLSLACAGPPPPASPARPAPAASPGGAGERGGKAGKRGGGGGGRRGGGGGGVPSPVPAPAGGGGGAYLCWAEGIYTNCTRSSGIQTCNDSVSRGGGQGNSQAEAGANAIVDCTDHMTQMVIIGNYPTGSADNQQWAEVKQSCQVTSCE